MSQMACEDSTERKKKKRKQGKIGLIHILRIFFLKETKIIPFPTNSKYNNLLQVDFFFSIQFYFLVMAFYKVSILICLVTFY